MNLTSRRLSASPSCASSNSHRNYSFRRGSVWSVRSVVSAEGKLRHLLHIYNRFRRKVINHIDFIVCYSCGLFYLTRWWEHNGTHTNTPHGAAAPGCFPTMHMCCRAAHCAPDGRWRSSGRWSCRWEAMKNLPTNHLINIFTHCSFRASHYYFVFFCFVFPQYVLLLSRSCGTVWLKIQHWFLDTSWRNSQSVTDR